MNAVVLAGGFGTRLMPLTAVTPKPMLSVANVPMLDYTVSHLCNFGIKDIVFTLGYHAEIVSSWADGYRDAKCKYVLERVPLGTAGGVKAAESLLDDEFLVVSGDALENIDFAAMLKFHRSRGADITMAVTKSEMPSLFGVVEIGKNGIVDKFVEKPQFGESSSSLVNCGVYIINKYVMSLAPAGVKFDFSRDLFPLVMQKGKIGAYVHKGYWSDIGSIESYFASNFHMLSGGFFPLASNSARQTESKMGKGLRANLLSASSSVVGHCGDSIVGANARISSSAAVDSCIVLDNVVVSGRHFNSIIGENFVIPVNCGAYMQNLANNFDFVK